jgi:DNA polymerase-4
VIYRVLHVDIDAFFASVEQVRDPRLAARPVIVGNGVIASCSYEARAFGLHAGMSLAEAARLCPQATVLDGHYPTYRAFAERVYDQVAAVSPCLDTYLDECYADLEGTERLHGDPLARARALAQAIRDDTGLGVTVGLGPNRMLAKMAGKRTKPAGLGAVTAEEADGFLAPLPVGDLLGVGPAHRRTLEDMNVRSVADLRRLPRETLAALFGVHGEALFERARGRDSRALTPREVPLSISRETAFHHDTADREEISGTLCYLTGRACRAARELGIAPRLVEVHAGYADGVSERGSAGLRRPTALDPDVEPVAEGLLTRLHRRRVLVRRVGVKLSRFAPAGPAQLDLLEANDGGRSERLVEGLDGVRDRFGDGAVISGRSVHLIGRLARTTYGFVLRTPSLTK